MIPIWKSWQRRSLPPLLQSNSWIKPIDWVDTSYFHGRQEKSQKFQRRIEYTGEKTGGTIFLLQPPTGAGKTSLLHTCWKLAEKAGRETADIKRTDLGNPDALRSSLRSGWGFRITGGAARAGSDFCAGSGGKPHFSWGRFILLRILNKGKTSLLLVLDEAYPVSLHKQLVYVCGGTFTEIIM